MSRRNRNREVNEVQKDQVIDAEFEQNEEETVPETEKPAEEGTKPGKLKLFLKKWGPVFGVGAGVALAAFIGGRVSGSNSACLDMLESEYGEGEESDDSENEEETDTTEETEEE